MTINEVKRLEQFLAEGYAPVGQLRRSGKPVQAALGNAKLRQRGWASPVLQGVARAVSKRLAVAGRDWKEAARLRAEPVLASRGNYTRQALLDGATFLAPPELELETENVSKDRALLAAHSERMRGVRQRNQAALATWKSQEAAMRQACFADRATRTLEQLAELTERDARDGNRAALAVDVQVAASRKPLAGAADIKSKVEREQYERAWQRIQRAVAAIELPELAEAEPVFERIEARLQSIANGTEDADAGSAFIIEHGGTAYNDRVEAQRRAAARAADKVVELLLRTGPLDATVETEPVDKLAAHLLAKAGEYYQSAMVDETAELPRPAA